MASPRPASLVLLSLCAALAACATKAPHSEPEADISYPLPECDQDILKLAQMRLGGANSTQIRAESVCVTKMATRDDTPPDTGAGEKKQGEIEAFSIEERALRNTLEPAFMKGGERPDFGIALSGGGTKASSFSFGVMAGLSDHGMLDSADYVSTVSGGGYAAYFYYAQHLFPLLRQNGRAVPTTADLYRDCIDLPPAYLATDQVLRAIKSVNHCARLELAPADSATPAQKQEVIKYQAFAKCTQDVLRPGECDTNTTRGPDWGFSQASLIGNLASVPLGLLSGTLFDWGLSTSTSARTYRDGIGISSGVTIKDANVLNTIKPGTAASFCEQDAVKGATYDCAPNIFDPDPKPPLSFSDLKTGLLQRNASPESRLPFWIINATAPKHRSAYGWIAKSREDITNSDMFEMTAVSHGSGRYGYVSAPVSIYGMSVLDAVAASAAFFDSNQLVYTNRAGKFAAGFLMHTLNFDWGYDIPNYNVSTLRRNIHRALPIGLYYLDGFVASKLAADKTAAEARDRIRSSFIRIIDGGNSENLGVYSLIKRNTRTILISDAAQDQKGLLGDICGLKARLQNVPGDAVPKHLYIPGLNNFQQHCDAGGQGEGYSVHNWPTVHPVLLGCIRLRAADDPERESCQDLKEEETRLFIVKPAINMQKFAQTQFDFNSKKVAACLIRGAATPETEGMLNCDSAIFLSANIGVEDRSPDKCPLFPQHTTARMTANSSTTLFVAYRELGRQYIGAVAEVMKQTINRSDAGKRAFAKLALTQHDHAIRQGRFACPVLPDRRNPT